MGNVVQITNFQMVKMTESATRTPFIPVVQRQVCVGTQLNIAVRRASIIKTVKVSNSYHE